MIVIVSTPGQVDDDLIVDRYIEDAEAVASDQDHHWLRVIRSGQADEVIDTDKLNVCVVNS